MAARRARGDTLAHGDREVGPGASLTVSGTGGEKRGVEINGSGGLERVNISVSEGAATTMGSRPPTPRSGRPRRADQRLGRRSELRCPHARWVKGFDLLTLQGFKISASGGTSNIGIHNGDTGMEISNRRIEADGGTSIGARAAEPSVGKSDEVRIDNSLVRGATNAVQGTGGANVKIGASRLYGGLASGVNARAGVYDENYAFSASTCP